MWGRLELLAWVGKGSGEEEVVASGDVGVGEERMGSGVAGKGKGKGYGF